MSLRSCVLLLFALEAGCDSAAVMNATVDLQPPLDLAPSYEAAARAASWRRVPGAPMVSQGKQDDLFFPSPARGFAVSGPKSAIYRTLDGGTSWSTVKSLPGTYFRSVLFPTDMHGFASNLGPIDGSGITDPNVLYETKDGGDSWAKVTAITGPAPKGICNQSMADPMHLFAAGRVQGPSFLLRSADGGASWTSSSLAASLAMLIDVHFTSPDVGLVVGGTSSSPMRCTILRTTDGGKSFAPVFVSAGDDTLCWKIDFPSPQVGYVSIQDLPGASGPATFAKTLDGGLTWTEKMLSPDPYSAIGIGFLTESVGWVSSDDPAAQSYKTTDGGESWMVDDSLPAPVNRFRFLDRKTAFAIGGAIYQLQIDWQGN